MTQDTATELGGRPWTSWSLMWHRLSNAVESLNWRLDINPVFPMSIQLCIMSLWRPNGSFAGHLPLLYDSRINDPPLVHDLMDRYGVPMP